MVRKWSLKLALVLWMASTGAYALGLGEIQLNSALNQNLNADIELLSVDKGALDDVRVILASKEAFSRAGVDRPFFLTKLQFKAEHKKDGSAVIHVTSREAIREPFLNFLIEVNWPKGRLVREYTVLLDPPVTLARKPAPVASPKAATPRVTAEPKAKAAAAPADIAADSYTVKKGESLWSIANRSRHRGVDMNQMLMAIYHANPDAFFNGNINNLKAGAILRIPGQEEALQIGRTEARDQYREHVNAWMAERQDGKVAEKPKADAIAPIKRDEEETAAAEAAPVTEAQAAASAQPAESELKIATARPEGEGEAGASDVDKAQETVAQLNNELLLTQEGMESAKQEGEELDSRVQDLEGQLEDLERILAIKSEQLARLQGNLAKEGQAAPAIEEPAPAEETQEATTGPETAEPVDMAEEAVVPEEAAETETSPVEEEMAAATEEMAEPAPQVEEPEAEPAMEEEPAEPQAAEEAPAEPVTEESEQTPAPVAEQPEAAPEPKPAPQAQPAPQPQPVAEPGLLEGLLASTGMMGAALGAVLVLLALVWLVMRRRKAAATEEEAEFAESILLDSEEEEFEVAQEDVLLEGSSPSEDMSLLTEFSPSDNLDALQDETSEVDPLSEADVYIAYGRYQQAEELIRQAINKDPDRDALTHKLFEILYAVKDADGFIKLAQDSAGTSVEKSDAAAWTKVLSMGRELDPDQALFAGEGGVETAVLESETFQIDEDELDFGEAEDSAALDLSEDAGDLDLDALAAELDSEDVTEQPSPSEDLGGLDELNMEDFASDVESEMLATDENVESIDLGEDLDLMLDAGQAESTDTDDLSLDLDQVDLESQPEAEEERLELPDAGELEVEELVGEDTAIVGEETAIIGEEAAIAGQETTTVLGDEEDIFLEMGGQTEDEAIDLEASEAEGEPDIELDLGSELSDDEIKVALEEGDEMEATSVVEQPQPTLDGDSVMLEAPNPDEVNTKLDLARAYIDMGDAEGAGYILDEVLVEGDEAQKQQAQELRGQLS